MDVSVRSDGKCGASDFSIERILSEDTRSSKDSDVTPDWLCCTRYRPPRIPRAVGSTCRARRSGRHARVPFTAAQAAALEAAYSRAPYLAPPALRALAAALQLRDDRIKIWFQNRRARERREKCSIITPPQAVTLPATTPQAPLASNSQWLPHPHTGLLTFHNIANTNSLADSGNENVLRVEVPQDLSNSSAPFIRSMFNGQVEEHVSRASDDRPETPLDIETLED